MVCNLSDSTKKSIPQLVELWPVSLPVPVPVLVLACTELVSVSLQQRRISLKGPAQFSTLYSRPPHPRRSPGPLRQTPVGVISAAASSQQLPDDDLLLPLGIFLQKSQTVCYCHKVEGAHAERAVAQLLCIRLMCCLQRLGSRYPSTSVSLVVPPCCCPGPPIYLVNCTLWSSMQALT